MYFVLKIGIIVEIKKENKYSSCKYFNCSWVSSYGNESECLFFGDDSPVKFHNIINLATGENYAYFVHALTIFNYVLTGASLPEDESVKKRDYLIMIQLMMGHDKADYDNQFPTYVNQLFAAFAEDRSNIKINLDIMKTDYPGFETSLCGEGRKKDLVKLDYICRIFRNCEEISIYGMQSLKTNNKNNLVKDILTHLTKLRIQGSDNLRRICIYNVKYNGKVLGKKFYNKYTEKFRLTTDYEICQMENGESTLCIERMDKEAPIRRKSFSCTDVSLSSMQSSQYDTSRTYSNMRNLRGY